MTGFTYQPGIGNVYYETKSRIYDQATYHEQLAGHSLNGIERAYFVNADTRDTDLKPTYLKVRLPDLYLNTMISTLENQGYKVVAGINGIFSTRLRNPKGLTIHEAGSTLPVCPEYVISFDEDGNASLKRWICDIRLRGPSTSPP